MSFDQDYYSLLCLKDNQVRWLTETIMVIFFSLLFQDYQSLSSCGDNHGHSLFFTFPRLSKSVVMRRQSWSSALLYFSKTIKVYRHVETIMVIRFSLLFQDYQNLSSCGDNHGHPLFFTFPRQSKSVVMRRQSWSSAFLYFSKTIKVCCFVETINVFRPFCFKDYQSLPSRLQCILYFARLQGLFVDIPDASHTLSFDRFHCLGFH